jgi:hypothetical protein
MLGCNSYFGDGPKTDIFDGYLYVMRFFIYSGVHVVWMLNLLLYFLKKDPLHFL